MIMDFSPRKYNNKFFSVFPHKYKYVKMLEYLCLYIFIYKRNSWARSTGGTATSDRLPGPCRGPNGVQMRPKWAPGRNIAPQAEQMFEIL